MKFKENDYVKVIDQEIYGKVIFVHTDKKTGQAREIVIEDLDCQEFSAPFNQLSYRPSELIRLDVSFEIKDFNTDQVSTEKI
tara:strand:- start:1117 stop:1362 length:246 start_codon:yes stop_codon:yes gene_type:complete